MPETIGATGRENPPPIPEYLRQAAEAMAEEGYGIDDVVVVCGISRVQAREIVFGRVKKKGEGHV